MIKRIISVCLAAIICLSVCGCASKKSNPKNNEEVQKGMISDLWKTPYLNEKGFDIDLALFHANDSGRYQMQALKNTIRKLGLGTTLMELTPEPFVGEWGIVFTGQRGGTDGRGQQVLPDNYASPPKDRQEQHRRLVEFLTNNYKLTKDNHPWTSMNGIYPWQHYAGEMGFDRIGVEIGENISSYQSKIAFTRGAGRQYGKTWFVDFSAWHNGYMLDYSENFGLPKIWTEGGVNHGHSMELTYRAFMLSYLSGTNFFIFEGGSLLSFNDKIDDNGLYSLTPYGEVVKTCSTFAKENPDIGTTYTPFGIVYDYYHGTSGGDDGIRNDAKLAWNLFPYENGDNMSYDLMNMFYPNSFQVVGYKETTVMVDSPYGDSADVLLQNAGQDILNTYPVIILTGDIKFSDEEINRYYKYVEQGGTLLVNTVYLSQLTKFKDKYTANGSTQEIELGKGKAIVYGKDYDVSALKDVLPGLLDKYYPFKVSTGIEYFVNIKDDGSMLVNLINNNGVVKQYNTPVEIDNSKTRTVKVEYKLDKNVSGVKNLVSGTNYAAAKSVEVDVKPGEVVVLEFKFK